MKSVATRHPARSANNPRAGGAVMVFIQATNQPRAVRLFAIPKSEILLKMKMGAIPLSCRLRGENLRWFARASLEYTPGVCMPREEYLWFETRPAVLESFEWFACATPENNRRHRDKEYMQEVMASEEG